jgi:hypothetical protein
MYRLHNRSSMLKGRNRDVPRRDAGRMTSQRSHRISLARLIICAAGALLGITTTLVVSAPASNAAIRANSSSVWAFAPEVIINVNTGAKDTANHTQLVNYITILPGGSECGKIEAWTQGWYKSTVACTQGITWYINRWVSSGQNVCGAFTDYSGNYSRNIACISIRV